MLLKVHYGAVAYVRIEYKDKTVSVRFVAAKTKVAPLQSVNIPRMELMGTGLGVKLVQSTVKVIGITYVVMKPGPLKKKWFTRLICEVSLQLHVSIFEDSES